MRQYECPNYTRSDAANLEKFHKHAASTARMLGDHKHARFHDEKAKEADRMQRDYSRPWK